MAALRASPSPSMRAARRAPASSPLASCDMGTTASLVCVWGGGREGLSLLTAAHELKLVACEGAGDTVQAPRGCHVGLAGCLCTWLVRSERSVWTKEGYPGLQGRHLHSFMVIFHDDVHG